MKLAFFFSSLPPILLLNVCLMLSYFRALKHHYSVAFHPSRQSLMEMQSRHGARTSDPDQQAYLAQRGESRVIVGFQGSRG